MHQKIRSANESIKVLLPCLQKQPNNICVTKRDFRTDQRSQTSGTDGNSQTQKQRHQQVKRPVVEMTLSAQVETHEEPVRLTFGNQSVFERPG